jgi:hypothetical protein
MSFLKIGSGNLSKSFKRSNSTSEHHDAAVERAREQFMRDVERQRLQPKPLLLSTPKVRQHKGFRKTVRSSRATEYGDGVKSEHQLAKSESKIRSFSSSLRDKVKRVLGRSSSKENNMPAQQLDASRTHFRDYLNGTDVNQSHEEYHHPQSSSRSSLYVPQQEDTLEDLEAITRSLKSARSHDSLRSANRSRLTSWTNSTMTNSIPGRVTPMERKRLSIIQEHGGPHQPSSSIGRHMDEVSATHLPLRLSHSNTDFSHPIDSQRVYSALMKRIDQEQEERGRGRTPTATTWQESSQNFTSSAQSFQTAPTIRQVESVDSIHTLAPDDHHRQFSLHAPSWHIDEQEAEAVGKTPQQVAAENEMMEKHRSRITELETQSSFFPFSSENKPTTPSPFKVALDARREQYHTASNSDEENGSVVITRSHVTQGEHTNPFDTRSESQYSRTTSGHLPLPMARPNPSQHDLLDTDEPPGMATIIPTRVPRYPRPSPSLAQLHKAKSSANVNPGTEWRTWMTSNTSSSHVSRTLANLERRNSKSSSANTNSHYREPAQIDGDDTSIGPDSARGDGAGRPRASAELARRSSVLVEKAEEEELKDERRNSMMNERFPLVELKEVSRGNTVAAGRPRRSSSVSRIVSEPAEDVKRDGLALVVAGAVKNDENFRVRDKITRTAAVLGAHPARGKHSKTSLHERGEEPVSTPGKMSHHHQQQQQQPVTKAPTRQRSSVTIRSAYARIASPGAGAADSSGDELPHRPRTISRLSRPFDEGGYDDGSGGLMMASPPPGYYADGHADAADDEGDCGAPAYLGGTGEAEGAGGWISAGVGVEREEDG